MKIGLIKGSSTNDVLRICVDEIAFEAVQTGHSVELFDLLNINQIEFSGMMHRLITSKLDIIIAMNGWGVDMKDASGEYIYNRTGAIIVIWMVDDPSYHYARITAPLLKKIVLYPNASHVKYVAPLNSNAINRTMLCGCINNIDSIANFSGRANTITVAMGWHGNPEPFWERIQDNYIRGVVEKTVHHLSEESELCVYDVFEHYCTEMAEVNDFKLKADATISYLLCAITGYFRKLDRINVIKKLGSSNIPFTLVGNGWDHISANFKKVKIIPEMRYSEIRKIYEDSMIVINANAANGGCERAFLGMISGAMVVSDYNYHLEKIIKPESGIVFYNRSIECDIVEKIDALLSTPDLESQALRGYSNCLENHRWRHRISEICSLAA